MAIVTKIISGDYATWQIKTNFATLTVNVLFTFVKIGGEFRVSEDDGNTWGTWTAISFDNIRDISVDVNNSLVIAEYRNQDIQSFLLINDVDKLLINDTNNLLTD